MIILIDDDNIRERDCSFGQQALLRDLVLACDCNQYSVTRRLHPVYGFLNGSVHERFDLIVGHALAPVSFSAGT